MLFGNLYVPERVWFSNLCARKGRVLKCQMCARKGRVFQNLHFLGFCASKGKGLTVPS